MSGTEGHEHAPMIDYENLPAPTEGMLVTHFITVRNVARSRAFYSEVLGGRVERAAGHVFARALKDGQEGLRVDESFE